MKTDIPKKLPPFSCKNCWQASEACLCTKIKSQVENRIPVLILQHPQELKNKKGTARLVSLTLKNGVHRIGFSWRSLSQALGEKNPNLRWAVLYVGTKKKSTFEKDEVVKIASYSGTKSSMKDIGGFILLDGNWKESKTLWWRNPWLSRMPIVQLNPKLPAKYNQIAREPRKNCLSTLESLALLMQETQEKAEVFQTLEKNFDILLRSGTA